MKNWPLGSARKIGHLVCSWGFLKFVLFAVTFVILLYAEEDWRGAHEWAATKAKWEARGISFDFQRLVPPLVPDDQNLAALPLFKMEPDPENNGNLAPLALHRATTHSFDKNSDAFPLPTLGDWPHGKRPDIGRVHKAIAAQYGAAFPGKPLPAELQRQFAELYPFIGDLRGASVARPFCRFEQNYDFNPPQQGYLNLITAQIYVSKLLTIDAVIALDAGQPSQALDDIRLNEKLAAGLRDQPILVSGFVAIGMAAINFDAVYEGLARHAWNDEQLAELESILARIDFLTDYQRLMRGETIGIYVPAIDLIKATNRDYFAWPYGWIDLMKAHAIDMNLTASTWVDTDQKLALPRTVDAYDADIDRQFKSWTIFPWNWLFRLISGQPQVRSLEKFSQMQVWVDQARIACALERYRLAYGNYPAVLDALVPACIDAVPHDIFAGHAYHYQPKPDGTFLLYSIGWNQVDDGGKEVTEKDTPTRDYTKGDWVWPQLQR